MLNVNNHPPTCDFLQTMLCNNLIPRILHPTRITSSTATLIDNIFYNSEEYITVSANINASLSDHLPQFLFLKDFFSEAQRKQDIYKRDFSKFDNEHFASKIETMTWAKIYEVGAETLNEGVGIMLKEVTDVSDQMAPIKKIKHKKLNAQKPWVSKSILKDMKKRDKIFIKYVKEKHKLKKDLLWEEYKVKRNLLNEPLRKSKNRFYLNFFETNKQNCKKTWEGINNIMNPRRSRNKTSPTTLEENGKNISDKKKMLKALMNFLLTLELQRSLKYEIL